MNMRFVYKTFALLYAIILSMLMILQVYAEEPNAPVVSHSIIHQMNDDTHPTILEGNTNGSPVLRDVRALEQGNQMLLVKTWDVPPGYDPERLVEADFERGGLHYRREYVLLVSENYDYRRRLASQTITITHDTQEESLAKLLPLIEYNQGGYTGQLALDASTIVTTPTGHRSYSYAITDVRQFPGLSRNDPSLVPRSVLKNGVQLQLVDLSWRQTFDGEYIATASYRGVTTGTTTSGYITTAIYMGEVSQNVLSSVTYAVVYVGSLIPPPPFDFSPYILIAGGIAATLIIAAILLRRRDNTKVYAMIGKEYQLVHKQKLTNLSPIIDLSPREISGHSDEFMIVLDRLAARKMRGHCIKIIGKDGMMKEQQIFKIRHFHIGQTIKEDLSV